MEVCTSSGRLNTMRKRGRAVLRQSSACDDRRYYRPGRRCCINAANHSLLGWGGVDGAIHRTGGPAILAACQELRRTRYPDGLPTGEATITPGGRLPARYVIHTVGPVNGRHDGKEADLLATCYHNALALAVQHHLRSLAFPAISTGAFGYPRDKAAAVASATIRNFLNNDSTLQEVRLIFFSPRRDVKFLRHQRFHRSKDPLLHLCAHPAASAFQLLDPGNVSLQCQGRDLVGSCRCREFPPGWVW